MGPEAAAELPASHGVLRDARVAEPKRARSCELRRLERDGRVCRVRVPKNSLNRDTFLVL